MKTRKFEFSFVVDRDGEVECTCTVNYSPGWAGVFGGPPDGWAPPEPADVDVISLVRKDTGEDITSSMTDDEYTAIAVAADDHAADEYGGPDPDDERDRLMDLEDDGDYLDRKYSRNGDD